MQEVGLGRRDELQKSRMQQQNHYRVQGEYINATHTNIGIDYFLVYWRSEACIRLLLYYERADGDMRVGRKRQCSRIIPHVLDTL